MATQVVRNIPVGMADVYWQLRLAGDPERMLTTMSFDFAAQPTVTEANALFNAFKASYLNRIGNVFQLEICHILYQVDGVNQIAVDSNVSASSFAQTNATLPQNCAVLIKKQTNFAGRNQRGRMYIPGVPENEVNTVGTIPTADLLNWQNATDAFFAAIAGYNPVLIHSCSYDDASEPPCVPLPATPITALRVDSRIATQRRRLR